MRVESVVVVDLPLSAKLVVPRPERLALRFGGGGELGHIWHIAYLRRKPIRGKPNDLPIDEKSLLATRREVILKLAHALSEAIETRGVRAATARAIYRCIKSFTDWADAEGGSETLWLDATVTARFFLNYAASLRVKVSTATVKHTTAAATEQALIAFLRELFGSEFCPKFKPLQQKGRTATRPPDEADLGNFTAVLNELFESCSAAVLETRPFPVKLLENWESKPVWFIPNGKSRRTLLEGPGSGAWDVETGSIRSQAETQRIYAQRGMRYPRQTAYKTVKSAERTLREVNGNPRHPERLGIASLGCLAFASLLALQAGANEQPLHDLTCSPDLAEQLRRATVTRARFRALKFRAGGKEVTISVGVGFLPKLARYLALREFLLGGTAEDRLLVYLGAEAVRPLAEGPGGLLRKRVARLGLDIKHLGVRKLRAAKQDHLIRHVAPDVAAKSMNHSLATAMKSYSEGSHARNVSEMGTYLAKVDDVVLAPKAPATGIPSAVGLCREFSRPVPIAEDVPVVPACDSSPGCLFCNKYRLHADETDVRKLLSCRYVMRLTLQAAPSPKAAAKQLDGVLARIEVLLAELRQHDFALVQRLEHEVDSEERLDPFWAAKVEQLVLLGVV